MPTYTPTMWPFVPQHEGVGYDSLYVFVDLQNLPPLHHISIGQYILAYIATTAPIGNLLGDLNPNCRVTLDPA